MDTVRDPVLAALAPGERVVWRQQAPAERLARKLVFPIGFLIVWCGFLGYFLVTFAADAFTGLRTEGVNGFTLFSVAGAIFLAAIIQVGARALWSRARDYMHRDATHYALTDRRLLIASPRGAVVYGHADVARSEARDRDILFDWGTSGGRYRSEGFRAELLDIADAARVLALIKNTLATAKPN
jgi:hypothetical protein